MVDNFGITGIETNHKYFERGKKKQKYGFFFNKFLPLFINLVAGSVCVHILQCYKVELSFVVCSYEQTTIHDFIFH